MPIRRRITTLAAALTLGCLIVPISEAATDKEPLPDMTGTWDACQAATMCYWIMINEAVKANFISQLEAIMIETQLRGLYYEVYERSPPTSQKISSCAVQYNYMFRTELPGFKTPVRERCVRLMDEQYSGR